MLRLESKYSPAPARTTVRPLLPGLKAKPRRGAKCPYGLSQSGRTVPDWIVPVSGLRKSSPAAGVGGGGLYSHRSPLTIVRRENGFQVSCSQSDNSSTTAD